MERIYSLKPTLKTSQPIAAYGPCLCADSNRLQKGKRELGRREREREGGREREEETIQQYETIGEM